MDRDEVRLPRDRTKGHILVKGVFESQKAAFSYTEIAQLLCVVGGEQEGHGLVAGYRVVGGEKIELLIKLRHILFSLTYCTLQCPYVL